MAYMHIGKDFVPPDAIGKVTGRIKYAEDYTREGMVYARLLTSPIPHARVLDIDASAALAMEGVHGILTADEVYPDGEPQSTGLKILTNHPTLVGEPILALAAVDEKTAESAIAAINVTFGAASVRARPARQHPGRRPERICRRQYLRSARVYRSEVDRGPGGELPRRQRAGGGRAHDWPDSHLRHRRPRSRIRGRRRWLHLRGQLHHGPVIPHHSMEPRSAMAYWEDGKLYLHGTSQSLTALANDMAGIIGVAKEDLVFINAATGGGFGQRSRAASIPSMAIPAKLSQKLNRPVMMRITREEEFTIGGARQGFQGWIKVGFRPDGIMSACDMFVVSDNGGKGGGADAFSAADCISILYQTEAVRFRGASIATNTAHRGAQRGPGQNQIAPIIAPIMDAAADALGMSRLDIRVINSARTGDVGGPQGTPLTQRLHAGSPATGRRRLRLGRPSVAPPPAQRQQGDRSRHRSGLSQRRTQRPGRHRHDGRRRQAQDP